MCEKKIVKKRKKKNVAKLNWATAQLYCDARNCIASQGSVLQLGVQVGCGLCCNTGIVL